ncbi:MAG: hypothetical protein KDC44_17740, partial [Phaeodactylibacter sp.]|nr:hypothetical protein [Phaeodactylibacter sp.]
MKPEIIKKIEEVWDSRILLSPAPDRPNLHVGLMAYKEHNPKFALNAFGQIVGLNVCNMGLNDDQWLKIKTILEAEKVELEALNASGNRIRTFIAPKRLQKLQFLEVDDNPIENLPEEILSDGNAAILNFIRQIDEQEGTIPLYEAKLLIVGQPGAGKTTLLEKLNDPSYIVPKEDGDPNIESTIGVNIYEGWSFPMGDGSSQLFKANLWDFGGQEIQYMTHHFFLTPRALYVLMADDRKQNTEFDYWFRIINLLGKEKEDEQINVLVVLNEINHRSVTNFDLAKYRKSYPGMNIQMREVDFSVKDRRSDSIAHEIQALLKELPHIGDELPKLWVPIREELLEIRKEKPHISFFEFAAVCKKDRNGKKLEREDDQRFLSQYLHRLGVMLHYQEDDDLDNFVILKPQWAVDSVYSVLQDTAVVKNKGRFTKDDLKKCWKKFSSNERSRLLSLMSKDHFEICYPTSNPGEYIAPQLLPTKMPAFDWDRTQTMKLRYQYPFMPKGLISRLIVRLSTDIAENGSLVWKEGVVIEQSGCRALVEQNKTIKEGLEVLEIEVDGEQYERKFLLRHIMDKIEAIHHKSFKNISFDRMVPCICDQCKTSA